MRFTLKAVMAVMVSFAAAEAYAQCSSGQCASNASLQQLQLQQLTQFRTNILQQQQPQIVSRRRPAATQVAATRQNEAIQNSSARSFFTTEAVADKVRKSTVSVLDADQRHMLTGHVIGIKDGKATILTAAHDLPAKPIIHFANGRKSHAIIVGTSQKYDVGLLTARVRAGVEPIAIANKAPGPQSQLAHIGKRGRYRVEQGRYLGYAEIAHNGLDSPKYLASAKNAGMKYQTKRTQLVIAGDVVLGESGGGIVNSRGHLVGTVWGDGDSSEKFVYATYNGTLRKLLSNTNMERAMKNAGLTYDLAEHRLAQGDRGPF